MNDTIPGAILTATLELLGNDDGLSMRAIARRAGVGVGSLYDHFGSKEGLLEAMLQHLTQRNYERMEARLADLDGSAESVLERLLDDAFELYLARPALTRIAIRTIVRTDRLDWIQDERDRFARLLTTDLVSRLPDVDATGLESLALVGLDMLMGVVVSELHRDPVPERTAAARDRLLRMLLTELDRLRREPR